MDWGLNEEASWSDILLAEGNCAALNHFTGSPARAISVYGVSVIEEIYNSKSGLWGLNLQ